jgi:hypothetical protein
MTNEVAESNLNKWFWLFKYKMVDEYPEYHRTFDYIVGNSDDNGVLYEVMEFAHRHLEVDSELKGGWDNLNITDYLHAIDYGFMEWVE